MTPIFHIFFPDASVPFKIYLGEQLSPCEMKRTGLVGSPLRIEQVVLQRESAEFAALSLSDGDGASHPLFSILSWL